MDIFEVFTCLGICLALPVMIVWLVARTRQNAANRKADVMLKAIENGYSLDPDFFKDEKDAKSVKRELFGRFTGACVTTFMGIAFLIMTLVVRADGKSPAPFIPLASGVLLAVGLALFVAFFVGRKMMAKEIEAEENELSKKQ